MNPKEALISRINRFFDEGWHTSSIESAVKDGIKEEDARRWFAEWEEKKYVRRDPIKKDTYKILDIIPEE